MQGPRRQFRERLGSTLAEKYKLDGLLGMGGMAAVFDATNIWTGRRVAIKLLASGGPDFDEMSQRLMFEARAATSVAHPNIVEVLDMGREQSDGALYIVQEFLTGKDLRQILDERRSLPEHEAAALMLPIMAALETAHARGIIHRDLKPANIFVARGPKGEVIPKLLDFGVAKQVERGRSGSGLTRTGTTLGTPEYMSPEQANGDKQIGPQTDVWSLAVVLYEAIAGRCPFVCENYHTLLYQIVTGDPPPLEEIAPHVDLGVADVIRRALLRDRADRFPDMRAFRVALEESIETARTASTGPVRVTVESALSTVLDSTSGPRPILDESSVVDGTTKKDIVAAGEMYPPDAPSVLLEAVPPIHGDSVKRRNVVRAAAVVAFAVLLGGGMAVWFRSDRPRPSPSAARTSRPHVPPQIPPAEIAPPASAPPAAQRPVVDPTLAPSPPPEAPVADPSVAAADSSDPIPPVPAEAVGMPPEDPPPAVAGHARPRSRARARSRARHGHRTSTSSNGAPILGVD